MLQVGPGFPWSTVSPGRIVPLQSCNFRSISPSDTRAHKQQLEFRFVLQPAFIGWGLLSRDIQHKQFAVKNTANLEFGDVYWARKIIQKKTGSNAHNDQLNLYYCLDRSSAWHH